MFGKAFVRPLLLTIMVSLLVSVANFAQKKAASQQCDAAFCTLSGVRTLDPLIKSQLLYQLS